MKCTGVCGSACSCMHLPSDERMMNMTMIPMYKRCRTCGKKYSWNPDVGQFMCPYCLGLGLSSIFSKGKKKEEKNKNRKGDF